jgi:hypothetical protein
MARSRAIRHAAAGGSRFVFRAGCTLSVRPRESGDPEAKHTAKHFGLSKSGPPLPRGRTVIVARPELACSVAKDPLRAEQDSKQRRSAPVCMLRAGGRPHSSVLTSLASRGMARRQGAMPGLLQADVRQRPDHGAQRCTRALRRANGHLRLTPRQRSDRPGALCPWWFSPSVARGPVRVIADPQVPSRSPPHERLRKAPLEHGSG